MKAKTIFTQLIVLLAIAAATALVSCNDSDEPKDLTLNDVSGEYTGTFDFTPQPSSLNPAPVGQQNVAVALQVADGKVVFPEFPASTLVTALVGEEVAAGLIPMLGTITYEAAIGTPQADASQLSATLTPTTLRIDVGGVMIVLITIETPEKLVYKRDGSLSFTLKTTKCQLGEGAEAGEPFDLVNELAFTLKKK